MKLSKSKIITIIILISISLIGLLWLQIFMFNHALKLEHEIFHQNVNAALNSIIEKLENQEALKRVFRIAVRINENDNRQMAMIKLKKSDSLAISENLFWVGKPVNPPDLKIDSNKIVFQLNRPQNIKLRILDSLGREVANPVSGYKSVGQHQIELPDSNLLRGEYLINLTMDSSTFIVTMVDGKAGEMSKNLAIKEKRKVIVEKVLNELSEAHTVPIEKRINFAVLDSITDVTLNEKGIKTSYLYGIVSANNDSIIMVKPGDVNQKNILSSNYRARLFPNDIFVTQNDLVLLFPREKIYLFKQIGLWSAIVLIFILIIIVCFIYVIRTIFKQKQLSNLLVDFINNMTHEFKTPISTISLASEMLTNPAIIREENRLKKHSKIIQDESLRMREQVERILQMAALEDREVEFNLADVDVHDLIQKAVENFILKIKNQNGNIETDFQAESYIIQGDHVHLGNIIHNLLDNAIKYTKKSPEILITTENTNNKLKISVQDNGIGITPEDQKHVFDKYFRVPTGNIHDVKGFGLGLSYVKFIVEAHGGTVDLKSEIKKGSIFNIYLPVEQN